jgi:hypothetical protein
LRFEVSNSRHAAALEWLADAYEQGVLLEDSGPPH